jgi:arylsulfatase A-like enzyme
MTGIVDPRRVVRPALAIGMIGGVLLGVQEGIATFAGNAFVDPGRHALAYLVVPVSVWFVFGPLVLIPIAAIGRLFQYRGLAFLASAMGVTAALLAMLPVVEQGFDQLHEVGVAPKPAVIAVASLALVAIATTAAVLARGAGVILESRPRLFRAITRAAAMVGLAALAWTGSFLTTNLSVPSAQHQATLGAPAPDGAPNVLLISIDTLRTDALGAYGNAAARTPILDKLGAEGVTFERAISPAPWTLPAVASIMTGLYPRHHGAGGIANRRDPLGRTPLAPGIPTLADAFVARGYRTHAIVTNPYLLVHSGLSSGFESYENLTFLSEAMLAGRRNAAQWLFDHVASRWIVGDRGVEVSDHAVRWIGAAEHRRPFFLWLHYIDPHGPYGGAAGSRHKTFRGDSAFGATGASLELDERSPDPVRLRSGEIRLGDDDKRAVRALYDREVTEVDRQIGRVLAALERQGIAGTTLVVCVSDHGEEFWDHGGTEHGHTLYDELIHVPLIMRWPGHLPSGLRVASIASTVDVAPTVEELVFGASAPRDGMSLMPLLRGGEPALRTVISENLLFAEERTALRTDRAKLIRWANGKEEAYDLRADPAERRDLAGVEAFIAPLELALDEAERTMPPVTIPIAGRELPAGALRALGYVN